MKSVNPPHNAPDTKEPFRMDTPDGSHSFRSPLVSGLKARLIRTAINLYILWTAFLKYRHLLTAIRALRKLKNQRRRMQGNRKIRKYVKASGRYYWSNIVPGWPSPLFRQFINNELSRADGSPDAARHLNTLIFSVTGRCPLNCEHCFEFKHLDSAEHLSLDQLKAIQDKFQRRGVDQIQLSGGEPLSRFDDTIELMQSAAGKIDFWLLTSGFGLTPEKARRLKAAGLVGANISLDHWDERRHNAFRGNDKSFFWVRQAADNCRRADIIVCLSLCANRDFVSRDNLCKYVRLARDWGAGFVRILEPRKVGGYADKDVELNDEQLAVLQDFYLEVNSGIQYDDLPILMYPGYHQRALGCFGAGDRYLYIDSLGDIHACPFCQSPVGNALIDSLDTTIAAMKTRGCHKFKTASAG